MYVTIKTSQRAYITDPERWLGESLYFNKLFSGKWGDKQEDGSYFIESDANIFEHVLRYLHTGVLPVFYDRLVGHDFLLYQSLLQESKYFAIDRLQKWLCEPKYLDAVKIHYTATETQDRGSYRKHTRSWPDGHTSMLEDHFVNIETSSNMEITIVPITQQRNSIALTQSMARVVKNTVGAALVGQGMMEFLASVDGERRTNSSGVSCERKWFWTTISV